MTTFRFIACNAPGTIYEGTQDHFEGLDLDGYQPSKVSDKFTGVYLESTDPYDHVPWPVVQAPEHWAERARECRARRNAALDAILANLASGGDTDE